VCLVGRRVAGAQREKRVLRSLDEPSQPVVAPQQEVGDRVGPGVADERNEAVTKILVEQQLHAAEPDARRRSRAAAKARAARMCSGVSAGKSARSWGSVIPPAKYSSTS